MSGFELSKRFSGEPIDCTVMVWHGRFESKKDKGLEAGRVTAPHASSFLGVGFGGEWKQKSFYLDPKQAAIRIGNTWILIQNIDAASQFTVEKEHAVAFPHEETSKRLYVSGHVGLHLHDERSGEAFTIAFPGYELADVAFDAVNKLSYALLAQHIFEEADDDGDSTQDSHQPTSSGLSARRSGLAATGHPRRSRRAGGPGGGGPSSSAAAMRDDDDDGHHFVATSGTELLDRGRHIDINDFTTFFLLCEGAGDAA